jgi:hypothetical protein
MAEAYKRSNEAPLGIGHGRKAARYPCQWH